MNDRQPLSVRGSATSAAAAKYIAPLAGGIEFEVFKHLSIRWQAAPSPCITGALLGSADHEIATALMINPSTARARRVSLCEKGLVSPLLDAGEPVTVTTPSGRQAQVWAVTCAAWEPLDRQHRRHAAAAADWAARRGHTPAPGEQVCGACGGTGRLDAPVSPTGQGRLF